jgi:8-oxo-dGTP pyrophosphatase MutT (NUDIX family)
MFNKKFSKRNNFNTQKIDREISSGIIVFRKILEEPHFLILYYGRGQWTFPRGKIEKEEKSFDAALRETREETGLLPSDLSFFSSFKAYENWIYRKNQKKIHKTVIFYLAQTDKKNIKIEERSLGYGWFTYREALKIFIGPKNSENRKVLRLAYKFLLKKSKPSSQTILAKDANS